MLFGVVLRRRKLHRMPRRRYELHVLFPMLLWVGLLWWNVRLPRDERVV
jgi:hypothetical protein